MSGTSIAQAPRLAPSAPSTETQQTSFAELSAPGTAAAPASAARSSRTERPDEIFERATSRTSPAQIVGAESRELGQRVELFLNGFNENSGAILAGLGALQPKHNAGAIAQIFASGEAKVQYRLEGIALDVAQQIASDVPAGFKRAANHFNDFLPKFLEQNPGAAGEISGFLTRIQVGISELTKASEKKEPTTIAAAILSSPSVREAVNFVSPEATSLLFARVVEASLKDSGVKRADYAARAYQILDALLPGTENIDSTVRANVEERLKIPVRPIN